MEISFPSLMMSKFTIGKYDSVQLDTRDFLQFLPFPVKFFFSFCLLFFFALRPLLIVLVTSSYGSGRRELF